MKITRDNYEAFYLDYIEGNLDEAGRDAFRAFLALNPDLALDADLPVLDTPQTRLSDEAKHSLYRTDLELDTISSANIVDFLTADLDGLLTSEKATELEAFMNANPQFERERSEIARLKLIPDASEVYRYQKTLKKGQIRYLRPLIAASAVAASLVLVFLATRPESVNFSPDHRMASRSQYAFPQHTVVNNPEAQPVAEDTPANVKHGTGTAVVRPNTSGGDQTHPQPVSDLPGVSLTRIAHNLQKSAPDPAERYTMIPEEQPRDNRDYALNDLSGMSNPITPITKKVSELIHEEVDFRSKKSDRQDQKSGFYLKIGKFEIFHKK